ncbi:MAG: flagellar biosynthetic protein FliO [Labilithrix sp.]|nr:flagellar biosynthetic protein FliO [Labilithrix sp.]
MGSYAGYIVQTVVTLLAVCALAFVVLYGARRMGIGRPRGPIELVGLLPLDARRAIYLVKVAGRVIVVGASEAGFTKLGELPAGEMPTEENAEATGFSDVLARVLGRGKNGAAPANGGAIHERASRVGAAASSAGVTRVPAMDAGASGARARRAHGRGVSGTGAASAGAGVSGDGRDERGRASRGRARRTRERASRVSATNAGSRRLEGRARRTRSGRLGDRRNEHGGRHDGDGRGERGRAKRLGDGARQRARASRGRARRTRARPAPVRRRSA